MSTGFHLPLALLHAAYTVYEFLFALRTFIIPRQSPQPLLYPRARIPNNLAIAFASDEYTEGGEAAMAMLESVRLAIQWSLQVGIQTLTVYDRHGLLKDQHRKLELDLTPSVSSATLSRQDDKMKPDTYLMTPPPSDNSSTSSSANEFELGSRVVSFDVSEGVEPQIDFPTTVRRRELSGKPSRNRSLHVNLVSSSEGGPAIARAATTLAHTAMREGGNKLTNVTIEALDAMLRDDMPPPPLLLVHSLESRFLYRNPKELHGFPPWQLRLTEIHFASPRWRGWGGKGYLPIEEESFRKALDEYSEAEMREGR